MRIELTVNGKLYHADVPPLKLLLAVLREDLGFTGAKEGCGEGECGACSVIMATRLSSGAVSWCAGSFSQPHWCLRFSFTG